MLKHLGILCFKVIVAYFSQCVYGEMHKSSPPNKVGQLTLYKDRCVACLSLQFEDSKYKLDVPGSIDPQSILFSGIDSSMPKYKLFQSYQDCQNTYLSLDLTCPFNGEISYSFSGITWHMHYVVEINDLFDRVLNFNSFISIDNQSGANFENVSIRLIDAQTDNLTKYQNFQEYSLDATQTICGHEITRISWMVLCQSQCEQDYRLDVGGEHLSDLKDTEKILPLQVWLRFKDTSSKSKDLSRGNVEIYVRDKNSLRYLGNSILAYTKAGEYINLGIPTNLLLQLTSNQDSPLSQIQGLLEQTEFKVLLAEKITEAAYRLTIYNGSTKEVNIKVMLPFGKNHGKVVRESMEHREENARCVYWPVKIPAKSETVLRYRIQLTKE